jgi:hypothetical protein
MRYAQVRSISERVNYRLNFDTGYTKYWLSRCCNSQTGKFERLKGRFGKVYNINENLQLEYNSEFINFYPNGKIDKVNIYLSNRRGKIYTVSTEAQSGYVREFDYKR